MPGLTQTRVLKGTMRFSLYTSNRMSAVPGGPSLGAEVPETLLQPVVLQRVGFPKPRNPRHFDRIEGRRNSVY